MRHWFTTMDHAAPPQIDKNMIVKITKSIYRRIVLFLANKILSGTNPRFFDVKRKLFISIGHTIGENTKIVGPIFCTGTLKIGKNCWIGTNFTVRGNGCVELGDNIDCGPDVTFLTGTHKIGDFKRRAGEGYNCTQTIGSGCWIGGKSVFVNNIEVGQSSIIAAAACVCKSIPENVVVGGIPARVLKDLD